MYFEGPSERSDGTPIAGRWRATYTPSAGVTLGTTKTAGAEGTHHLAPVAVAHLRLQREAQGAERSAAGELWVHHRYEGEPPSHSCSPHGAGAW